jgi:hypothetical protein
MNKLNSGLFWIGLAEAGRFYCRPGQVVCNQGGNEEQPASSFAGFNKEANI